jgi:HK97 family phage portal protein
MQGEGKLMVVTPENAMKLNTVFSCVKLITDTYTLVSPKIKYETPQGIISDPRHDQATLLKREPNPLMSWTNFAIDLVARYELYGHGYAKLIKDPFTGRPVQYKELPSENVMRLLDGENRLIAYQYTNGNVNEIIQVEDMIDICDIFGKSRISQNASSLQEYSAIRDYGKEMFKKGSFISGFIYGDKPMDPDSRDAMVSSWTKRTSNGEPGILPHGYKYEPLKHNIPMADAGIVLARDTTSRDICAMFGVPPSLVGIEGAADNKGEADFNSFLTTTIAPLCILIESEFNRKIFRKTEKSHFVSHDLRGIYRISMKDRYEAHRTAINAGFLSPAEVRELEGINPSTDPTAKELMKPLNMIPGSLWLEYYQKLIEKDDFTKTNNKHTAGSDPKE